MGNQGLADAPLPSAPSHPDPVNVSWRGNPWSLTGLCLLNLLLIVVTLGIYWFWARSEYRRYMWQMVRVEDTPLEYTGTGRELLIGYLRLFFLVILPTVAIIAGAQLAFGPQNPITILVTMVFYAGLIFLYFAGVFRAHRYILSRTRWRGVSFGLAEGAGGYAWISLWTALLSGLTLGWILPWRTVALRRRLTSAMRFGSIAFRFDGRSGPLYAPFAFLWLSFMLVYAALITMQFAVLRNAQTHPDQPFALKAQDIPGFVPLLIAAAVPIAILGYSWYEARKLNAFAEATSIGPLGSRLRASTGSVLWLTISNLLILVFTGGILRPVAQARRLRYLVQRFALQGSVDLNQVMRGQEYTGLQGAGLETAFSIEIF